MRETYLITGASRGIGKYLADQYESDGKNVIRLSKSTGCDVSDWQAVYQKVSEIEEIHVLINCAGIASMNLVSLMDPVSAARMVNTNIIGTHNLCSLCFSALRQTSGAVVNFSSIAGQDCIRGEALYGATKAAIEHYTRVLAKEYGSWGIRVNAIAPNPVETFLIAGVPQEKIEAIIARQAIKRRGTMQDIKSICDFLIKPDSLVTGQVIRMGG